MGTNDHHEVDEEVAQTQQVHLEEQGWGNVARGAEEGWNISDCGNFRISDAERLASISLNHQP